MFRTFLFLCTLLLAAPAAAEESTIELRYSIIMGTYTVPITIDDLGERNFTLDTGASLTVLRIEDVERLGLRSEGRAGVTFPHQGVRVRAHFYTLPTMKIGNCTIRNSRIIGIGLPEGRPGVLGMADLELISPFTFVGNGQLRITCPR